ncbi:hypothetical protein GCM10022221_17250 [Actinocorallia aurea]
MRWGRHRRTAEAIPAAPARPDAVRAREVQPRDGRGRFRRAGRDDASVGLRDAAAYELYDASDAIVAVPPHPPDHRWGGDGRIHCGPLEQILVRQWDAAAGPPPDAIVRAVESLAGLPPALKEKLARGLDAIYVGPGGVPDLDHMGELKGRALPSGAATWDICAGAYGNRKIVVGDRPSPTPDVMMHEVGHALDDVDDPGAGWASDSPEFQTLFRACSPFLRSGFHRQEGVLGRREFFADAFAAIASHQRPALVDMLGGNIRLALDVMLFFNRRYGI